MNPISNVAIATAASRMRIMHQCALAYGGPTANSLRSGCPVAPITVGEAIAASRERVKKMSALAYGGPTAGRDYSVAAARMRIETHCGLTYGDPTAVKLARRQVKAFKNVKMTSPPTESRTATLVSEEEMELCFLFQKSCSIAEASQAQASSSGASNASADHSRSESCGWSAQRSRCHPRFRCGDAGAEHSRFELWT